MHGLRRLDQGLDRDQGLSAADRPRPSDGPGPPAGPGPLAVDHAADDDRPRPARPRRRQPRRPARSRLAASPPAGAAGAAPGRARRLAGRRLPRVAGRPVRSTRSGRATRSPGTSSASSRSTTSSSCSARPSTGRSRCGRSAWRRWSPSTCAVLAFPIAYYMARVASPRVAGPARRRGAHAALGELPHQGLRVAADPGRGRRAQLGCSSRSASRARVYGDVAVWLVFTYLWLPYMILPDLRRPGAHPELAAGGVGRPRRPRLDDLPPGRSCRSPSRPSCRLDLHVLADPGRLHRAAARLDDAVHRQRDLR